MSEQSSGFVTYHYLCREVEKGKLSVVRYPELHVNPAYGGVLLDKRLVRNHNPRFDWSNLHSNTFESYFM